jgi:sarcosine oxidase
LAKYDVIVVGCGAMGSSASLNLTSRGLKVLTFDRFGLNHEYGSSHGRTRIIRLAYYEDERYVPMLSRAFELWRELEGKSGRRLLTMTGGLMIGKPDGELVAGVLRSAKAH